LFTAIICVICTFLISWILALVNLAIVAFFYFVVASNRKGLICKSSSSLLVCGNIIQVINELEHTGYYNTHFHYFIGAVDRKREGGSIEAILRRIKGIKDQRFLWSGRQWRKLWKGTRFNDIFIWIGENETEYCPFRLQVGLAVMRGRITYPISQRNSV